MITNIVAFEERAHDMARTTLVSDGPTETSTTVPHLI